MIDDQLIVSRAQAGHEPSRDELARYCQTAAYRYALHLIGDSDQARDIAQDAMFRFFKSLNRFDSNRPIRPWLYRIVSNLVRDRNRRRRTRPTEPLADLDVIATSGGSAETPEVKTQRRELQQTVWLGLRSLPHADREILVLREYLDLSYEEIALALKVPRGTVMSRLHRARKRLRKVVTEALGTDQEVVHA